MTNRIAFVFFSCLFFLLVGESHAQNTSILPDSQVVYTDLKRALADPTKVYKLRLKRKKYVTIPPEVFTSFPNLVFLDLSHNSITELPTALGNCVNLVYLNVSYNKLSALPSEIGHLKQLKRFILNNNEIVALPATIGEMKSLEYLDMWSNELGYYPDELKNISGNLKTMDLRAILIDIDQQKRIRELLPSTKIFFSPGCNCGK
jgi:Leucine-rich repeat (LRR) protein